MFLILAHRGDTGAVRVANELAGRQVRTGVRLLTAEDFGNGVRWVHRLRGGESTSLIEFPDGTTLRDQDVTAILSRIRGLPSPGFHNPADVAYGHMELFALMLSWLASLRCPVVNPPSGQGLCAPQRSRAQWLVLASRSGLATRRLIMTTSERRFPVRGARVFLPAVPLRPSPEAAPPGPPLGDHPAMFLESPRGSAHRVLVAGPIVHGGVPEPLRKGCLRLARLSECPLLELTFDVDPTDWRLSEVDPFPSIRSQEEAVVVAELLATEAGVRG